MAKRKSKVKKAKEQFGGVFGFISAERPGSLDALNVEQYLEAFAFWTASRLEMDVPEKKGMTIFLEGGTNGLVHSPPSASTLYRYSLEEVGVRLKCLTIAADLVLCIGSPLFLRECARILMSMCAPPLDKKYDKSRIIFGKEVDTLCEHVTTLYAGEACRFELWRFDAKRFEKTHMLPILTFYLKHGRQFDGVESSVATLPLVEMLSPSLT